MKLENILSNAEMTSFDRMCHQAHQDGATSICFYVPKRELVVIGVLGPGGVLQTWFLAPAATISECTVVESVVLAGINVMSSAYSLQMTAMVKESADLATEAIQKATQCPPD
jgi:hypothetical protein